MTKTALSDIFDGLSIKLQADFDFLSSQFNHRPSRGAAREFVLKELLRQHLPQKVSVGSGKIISSNGSISKQIDIIIYDTLNTPIIFGAGDNQIFPIECVYAVVEVKSTLNSTELKKSISNIRSVKMMRKTAFVDPKGFIKHTVNLYGKELDYFPVIGYVFAYNSLNNIKLLKDRLVELDDSSTPENNIDTICILNKAIISNWESEISMLSSTKEPNSVRAYTLSRDSLLHFYLLMMHIIPQVWMRPIQITKYAGSAVNLKVKF